jgi:hypothetical protein
LALLVVAPKSLLLFSRRLAEGYIRTNETVYVCDDH